MHKKFYYLWLLPFLSFLSGYFITTLWYPIPTVTVPSLVGLNLYEGVTALSERGLTMRILSQKEDSTLSQGTIISQHPRAQAKVKAGQSLFCVISKQPALKSTPNVLGLSKEQITARLSQEHYNYKLFSFISPRSIAHTCIAQFPPAHSPYTEKHMLIYVASTESKPIIWPNFVGSTIEEVKTFLAKYQITPKITVEDSLHENGNDAHALIIDQQPLAGSLITLDSENPPMVYLHAHHNDA
jgi:beta-lactam-binding protein with PASTA domain